jgi:peptidyl-prolyl cis-trans isomerase D
MRIKTNLFALFKSYIFAFQNYINLTLNTSMATLEKIRSKSVLLFTIIIVALLAFIMGDFLTSGRSFFGPGDTVASANGAKVKYNDYQERVNEAVENQKNRNGQNVDNDVVGEQVIEQLLVEALLDDEFDRMGITVTDKQLSNIMLGEQNSVGVFQTLLQQFGQQGASALYQKGIVDTRNYFDAMKNPSKYGLQAEDAKMLTKVWSDAEKNIDKGVRQQAYLSLLQGLFTANEVDAKALYNDRNTTTHFAYVRKDFLSVPDKDIKLTEDDYKAVYEENKGRFKLDEETHAVNYIIVPIVPSEADYNKGQKEVETVLAELNATEGVQALTNHAEFVQETGKYTKAALSNDAQLRALATDSTGLTEGLVRPLQTLGGNYTIAKVLGVSSGVDNLKFSAFGGLAADMDSVLSTLTAANFDSIAKARGGQAGIELSLVNPRMQLTDAQKSALASNAVGSVFVLNDTVNSQDEKGAAKQQIAKTAFLITERDTPVSVYDIAKITYSVTPSNETIRDLNTKFHAFVANNASAEAFAKNAEKNGYQINNARVSASTPLVGNAPSSRGAVKWAMNNGKGKVSPVFSQNGSNDYLLAVAVVDVYDGKYLPLSSDIVRETLKPIVLNNKKAEKLIKQFAGKGKSLQDYATMMGAPASQADAVFDDSQISGLGYAESEVQGHVAVAPKGKLVGPFKGNNAIYVISVSGSEKAGRPYNFKESAQAFNQKLVAALMQNPLKLLVGDNKVKNNILSFTADQVN